jgi:CheY-like chemotaxis protein
MTVDDFVKVLGAVTPLLSVLVWPILVGIALIAFRNVISRFFENTAEIKLKNSVGEVSFTRIQGQAAAALTAAAVGADSPAKESSTEATHRALETVETVVTKDVIAHAKTKSVLWVDDYPKNNESLILAFQSIGINVQTALSTEEAITRLSRERYDFVISDLGRDNDAMAGKTLIIEMKRNNFDIPFAIFASRRALQFRDDLIKLGAIECTNDANALFSLVIKKISGK